MGGCVPASPVPCELEDGVGRGVGLWGQNQEGGTVGSTKGCGDCRQRGKRGGLTKLGTPGWTLW